MSRLRVHIENYKAIKSADVELADLTVLAGVNSSGKSTVARLFHRLICVKAKYEAYAAEQVFGRFKANVLEPLSKALPPGIGDGKRYMLVKWMDRRFTEAVDFDLVGERLFSAFSEFLEKIEVVKAVEEPRFLDTLKSYLGPDSKIHNLPAEGVGTILQLWLRAEFDECKVEYARLVESGEGGSGLFFSADVAGERILPVDQSEQLSFFDVIDPREPRQRSIYFADDRGRLVDWANWSLTLPRSFSPRQSFYIARPSVDFPQVRASKLTLNGVQYHVKSTRPTKTVAPNLSLGIEELIGGTVSAPPEKPYVAASDWRFSQNNGRDVFDLNSCADGIKSLATLSILERYGLLREDSLLIIDEPEVHLHPQWVVAMARILVRLAKYLKVKVLITTHSPDLVHALRDFIENENFSNQACFYLAQKESADDEGYSFRSLGMNIGPIFSVFNVAKDEIASISRRIREGHAQ